MTGPLADFIRPIDGDKLPRLHAHSLRGLRIAGILVLLFSAGSPFFLVVNAVVYGAFGWPAVLACVAPSSLTLLCIWLARRPWGERHTDALGFLLLLVAVGSLPLLAWASPMGPQPMAPVVLALPPLLVLFFPMRPTVVMFAELPALAALYLTDMALGVSLGLVPAAFTAFAAAVVSGVGAQMLRRLWSEFEQTKGEVIAAGRLALLGQLSAGIAHELKTPIGAILNSQASVETTVDELRNSIGHPQVDDGDLREIAGELAAHSQRIRNSAERAARYVRAVRDHAAIRRHNSRTFAVLERVEEVLDLLGYQIRQSHARIDVDVHPGLTLRGEPEQFDHILSNLVSNALDACADIELGAGISITGSAAGGAVEVAVEDNGPGVGPEIRETVFEPMITSKADGTGLGLAISREIATGHFHGSLELEGSSRFVLRCQPVAERDREAS